MSIPFLTNLGIDPMDQGRVPNASAMPRSFNPAGQYVWQEAVQNTTEADPRTAWGMAIREYVELCGDREIYPFLDQDCNDRIFDQLRSQRQAVVNFIDSNGLFNEVKVRDVWRRVSMTDKGFQLEVHGISRLLDPSFVQWLSKMGFAGDAEEVGMVKDIAPGLTFYARHQSTDPLTGWHIGYRIVCECFPSIPGNPTASKTELEQFVLKVLWEPAFRMVRPQGLLHRLL